MIGNCWWLTVHDHDHDDGDDDDDEDKEYNGKKHPFAGWPWIYWTIYGTLHTADTSAAIFFMCQIDLFPVLRVGTLRKMMMIFDLAIPSGVCFPDYTPLARMFQNPSSLPTMHNTAMYLVNVRRSTCQHRVISTCCWDLSWLPFGNGNMMQNYVKWHWKLPWKTM